MSAFQITPFGIVIIAVYSFAIGLSALVLSRLLKNLRWRWLLLAPPALLLMALPWGEEAWIAWHFNEACKEAGVKVYRQVEVEGFYDGTMGTGYSFIEDYGFKFMEEKTSDGKIAHTERPDGQWKTTILEKPSARYHVIYAYQPRPHVYEQPIGRRLKKIESLVVDSQTGEILGRDVLVKRWASIADALWAQFIGSTLRICPDPDLQPHMLPLPFPQSVLKPISKP
ncbi:MAG TPA: hypothetical protein PLU47_15845 [Azonexus sp.]|nr:hypothetical protein [Azonexus sp.]